jgi:hypothetical protein
MASATGGLTSARPVNLKAGERTQPRAVHAPFLARKPASRVDDGLRSGRGGEVFAGWRIGICNGMPSAHVGRRPPSAEGLSRTRRRLRATGPTRGQAAAGGPGWSKAPERARYREAHARASALIEEQQRSSRTTAAGHGISTSTSCSAVSAPGDVKKKRLAPDFRPRGAFYMRGAPLLLADQAWCSSTLPRVRKTQPVACSDRDASAWPAAASGPDPAVSIDGSLPGDAASAA